MGAQVVGHELGAIAIVDADAVGDSKRIMYGRVNRRHGVEATEARHRRGQAHPLADRPDRAVQVVFLTTRAAQFNGIFGGAALVCHQAHPQVNRVVVAWRVGDQRAEVGGNRPHRRVALVVRHDPAGPAPHIGEEDGTPTVGHPTAARLYSRPHVEKGALFDDHAPKLEGGPGLAGQKVRLDFQHPHVGLQHHSFPSLRHSGPPIVPPLRRGTGHTWSIARNSVPVPPLQHGGRAQHAAPLRLGPYLTDSSLTAMCPER